MKKYISYIVLSFVALLVLVACGTKTEESNSSTATQEAASEITVTTGAGEVTVPLEPTKVVVFDLGAADTIRALGFEDTIVALPTASLPAYLSDFSEVTSAGSMKEPDLEVISELEPDLIIASRRTVDYIDQLSEIAPTIYFEVDSSGYWTSVKANIETLASIYGETAEKTAAEKIEVLEAEIKAVADKNADSDKTTLTMMLNEGNMSIFGAQSRFAFLYDSLGFKPTSAEIEDSRHGQEASFETISEINPDQIFVLDRTLAIGGDQSANADVLSNALIQGTTAGQNNAIVTLTSDLWYLSGGGLESTQLMIDDVKDYAGE